MSSSQRPERVVHQDYIARIRYSNALPPPPYPPKLLDIPGTGLAGGQYTSAGYASRLAREQPLNIEADAELGMPIDMIGVPGIFEGDERAISARPGTAIHSADKQLLRPLASLGKANATGGGVSFLRRTEYTASQGPQHFASNTSKDMMRLRNDPKRRKLNNLDRENPVNIIRHIVKGFDIAYPKDAYKGDDSTSNVRGAAATDTETKAWLNPKHPTKPDLQLLDSYPILPDLEALPTAGAYLVTKFQSNPLTSELYDPRLDTAILRPIDDPAMQAEYKRKIADWDPESSRPQPLPEYDYDYYVPDNDGAVRGIKRKFDVNDPEHDDPDLYTEELEEGKRGFTYSRVRTYETTTQQGNATNHYNDSVALALHDPEADVDVVPGTSERLAKGAYYYPIIQRTALRPKRKVGKLAASQLQQGEGETVDQLNLTIADLSEEDRQVLLEKRAEFDPSLRVVEAAA
jgi:RNA polymerase II-associated factor 1